MARRYAVGLLILLRAPRTGIGRAWRVRLPVRCRHTRTQNFPDWRHGGAATLPAAALAIRVWHRLAASLPQRRQLGTLAFRWQCYGIDLCMVSLWPRWGLQ